MTQRDRLEAERAVVQSALRNHSERCKASEPHGYIRCQLRYQRLQARLDEINRSLGRDRADDPRPLR